MAENWEKDNDKLAKKSKIPQEYVGKCHAIIHTASAAAGAAALIPIPMADHIPITAAQVTMVAGLAAVFGIRISTDLAKSILSVGLVKQGGQFAFRQLVKLIPGWGWGAAAVTAVGVTQAFGWAMADDFYNMSIGKSPKLSQLLDLLKGHI
ncbi:MAG: GTP-binding protein [Firmicutes bacterium]|nr:GTP-binding protein [Bacillota bacterium]